MPIGLFDSFDNLETLSPQAIAVWLKPVPALAQVENYLANKILYPQTLPLTASDMKLDLAILREALRANGPKNINQKVNPLLGDNPFLNITLRKILIPARFVNFVPDLKTLTWVFVDALLLGRQRKDWFEDLWTIVLTGDIDEIIGSIILPQFSDNKGIMELQVLNQKLKIAPGVLAVAPCEKDRCQISYKIKNGYCLGKTESSVEVYGGKLGVMVDGRRL